MANLARHRPFVPFQFYHVVLRSVMLPPPRSAGEASAPVETNPVETNPVETNKARRCPLFEDDADRHTLEEIVADAQIKTGIDVAAYCWLDTELHFVVRVRNTPLGRFIQRITSRYARHRLRGKRERRRLPARDADEPAQRHLFERNHVEALPLSEVPGRIKQIHQLPQQRGLAPDYNHYAWSSRGPQLRLRTVPWLNLQWFADSSTAELEAGSGQVLDYQLLARIVVAAARKFRIDPKLMTRRGARSQAVSGARALAAHHATRHGFTQQEMARRFRINEATLSVAITHYQRERRDLFAQSTEELLAEDSASEPHEAAPSRSVSRAVSASLGCATGTPRV